MEVVVTREQGRVPVTILHVKGNIDANTGDQFQTQAQELIKGGATNMLLDLSEVPYVSSYGIRALSALYKSLGYGDVQGAQGSKGIAKSAHLKLLNPSHEVTKVLAATGLDLFLEIYHDQKEAVASF